jgi:hypothetical protein
VKRSFYLYLGGLLAVSCIPSYATGLATCDSGPRDSWQPQDKLEKLLVERGWKIRRIKEDGGCFEVYAFDEKGERVEAYFHPKTFALVPTSRYPRQP